MAMDFDHRDDEVKHTEVARLKTASLRRLVDEILKCEVVCANCHRVRTQARKQSGTRPGTRIGRR